MKEGKYIDNLILKRGFEEVIMVVRNLAPILEERDAATDEIIRIQDEMGILDVNQVFVYTAKNAEDDEKFAKFKEKVKYCEYLMDVAADYIKANWTYIQLLLPHHSIVGNKVADLATNYYTYESKKRKGYLNLRNELLLDISNLQVRIRKL